jgi:hypothetical protein
MIIADRLENWARYLNSDLSTRKIVFKSNFIHNTHAVISMLGVCILLRVWDQGEGFASMQRYYSSFTIYSISCYMLSYDHLQAEICTSDSAVFNVNCFSKQSEIALTFSNGWHFMPTGPWIAVGALGPSLFVRHFAMGHIAWGGSSAFVSVVSHLLSAFFFWVIRLIDLETLLTAVLHSGFLVWVS